MKDIEIRYAVLDDLPTLLKFEQGIISIERNFDPYLKEEPISYYDIKSMILSEDSEVLVAVHNNRVIASGFVQIKDSIAYKTHDKYASLRFMFVDEEFRGKGINKYIIDGLLNWSKARKIDHAILNVYSDNEKAIKAYEKVGFKKTLIEMCMSI